MVLLPALSAAVQVVLRVPVLLVSSGPQLELCRPEVASAAFGLAL